MEWLTTDVYGKTTSGTPESSTRSHPMRGFQFLDRYEMCRDLMEGGKRECLVGVASLKAGSIPGGCSGIALNFLFLETISRGVNT